MAFISSVSNAKNSFLSSFGRRKRREATSYFETFTEYQPTFSTWRGGVYEAELTRSCIHAFANACSKLEPKYDGANPNGAIARAFRTYPNEFMTWPQFLYRAATTYEADCATAIVPTFGDNGAISGFFPVKYQYAEAVDYDGELWIRFHMSTGDVLAIEYSQCCIIGKYQYESDLFGTPNILGDTLELLDAQVQAEQNAIKIGSRILFIGKVTGMVKEEDMSRKRERFAEQNLSEHNKTGLMTYDQTFDSVTPVAHNAYTIDAVEMQRIDNHVYNYFGTNQKILQNDFSEQEWDSWYEGKVEPWAIQLTDGMNKMLFSQKAALTNKVTFTANRLQFMSAPTKRNMVRDMTQNGTMLVSEGREILGLPYLPGTDVFIVRGEYFKLDRYGNLIFKSGGDTSGLREPDPHDAPDFDLGGDDAIYDDVDGKYHVDVEE